MRTKLAIIVGLVLLTPVLTSHRAIAQDNGAIVISIQTPCHFFDADGVWTLAIGDCDFQIVVTPGLEIVNVTAHGQLPPSGTDARWDFESIGLPCVIDGTPYSTTKWQETLAPSGQVSMNCHFH
jgi:hypothetical protein